MPLRPLALLAAATMADALWTSIGLSQGLQENGPIAAHLLPHLGPLYWLLQFTVLLLIYKALKSRGLDPDAAASLAVLGPATAALVNMALVLA